MPYQTLVTNPDLTNQIQQLTLVTSQVAQFLSHLSLGGITAHGLEVAKSVPMVGKIWNTLGHKGKIAVGGLLAFLGSLGITATFAHAATSPDGTYVITVTGLTWTAVGIHGWSWFQSWAMQQAWWAQIINPTTVVGPSKQPIGAPAPPPVPVVEVKP